jgi:hypothetical protein
MQVATCPDRRLIDYFFFICQSLITNVLAVKVDRERQGMEAILLLARPHLVSFLFHFYLYVLSIALRCPLLCVAISVGSKKIHKQLSSPRWLGSRSRAPFMDFQMPGRWVHGAG